MKRLLTFGACMVLAAAGCRTQTTDHQTEITVSAAVSLRDAFTELGRRYEARTGARVRFNFGASGVLQKQIEQGAPVDVFASAGARQMDELAAKGLTLADTRTVFANNQLVLIVSADAHTPPASFAELARADVRKIAVGNPQTVPAGQYAQQLLLNMKLWEQLQPRLVVAEDVRQVLDYVARGEVEAGIVYATDVSAAQGKVVVAARAPAGAHDPILYPIAIIKDSPHAEAAREFVAFVRGPEGQTVLTRYGFLGPGL